MDSPLDLERLGVIRNYIKKRQDDKTTPDEMVTFFESRAVIHDNGLLWSDTYSGHDEIRNYYAKPPTMKPTSVTDPAPVGSGGDFAVTVWAGLLSRSVTFSFQRGATLINVLTLE